MMHGASEGHARTSYGKKGHEGTTAVEGKEAATLCTAVLYQNDRSNQRKTTSQTIQYKVKEYQEY